MRNRIIGLATALFYLGLTPQAAANWEYTRWGMSPAEVVAASHGAVHLIPPQRRMGPTGPDITTCAEGVFIDGKLHLNVSFGFAGHAGGLVLVTYLPEDASQNYLLRDRLVRAFGQPTPIGDVAEGSGVWQQPGQDVINLDISDEGPAFVVQHPPAHPAAPTAAAPARKVP
jgi:hypothetical protein